MGGGVNPWASDVVDAYLDLNNPKGLQNVYTGDMNQIEVWDKIASSSEKFDFSICSHTLEDIRDPVFVLQQIMRVSKSGYISFPSKHTEFSNHQSNFWNGSCHHRWVFSLKTDKHGDHLFFMPMWPGSAYFNQKYSNWWVQTKRILRLTNKDKNMGPRSLPWFDKNLSSDKNELAFIWERQIPFQYVDYTPSMSQMLSDYRSLLADGL